MRLCKLLLPVLAGVASSPAMAECKIEKIVEFPVTMAGPRPMVEARFGAKTARFILDSGAFYSTISVASAAEFGVPVESSTLRVNGIGGTTSAGIAVAKNFSIAGVPLPGADFVVGGSDTGTAGLIGQNILGLADVEYDLPHGVVRLMKTSGCARSNLAYWAGAKPFTMVHLEPGGGHFKPHTVGTVLLNGAKIRAVFDSGAASSLLSIAAAKRAGVTPDTPGVVRSGFSRGLGTHEVPSWLAPFDTIDIGGEAINHPKIRIAQIALGDDDMLIGADFFLTHRMFVSNAEHALFITYEGGPVFGLNPKGAVTSEGKALDLTDSAAEPTTAEGYSRRGAVFASNRHLSEALADFDKAVALAPNESRYVYQRALAHLNNRDMGTGASDLDRAIQLDPAAPEPRLTRAQLRLRSDDAAHAVEDIAAADAALAPSSEKRLTLANLDGRIDHPEDALRNYDLWLKSHPEDSSRPVALNGRCWARGLLDRELDKALSDCNAAIHAEPHRAAFLDSRGLIRLRRGEFAQAVDDLSAAIALTPRNAWTLYVRGLASRGAGNAAQADADRAAALAIDPKVAVRARRIGLER